MIYLKKAVLELDCDLFIAVSKTTFQWGNHLRVFS